MRGVRRREANCSPQAADARAGEVLDAPVPVSGGDGVEGGVSREERVAVAAVAFGEGADELDGVDASAGGLRGDGGGVDCDALGRLVGRRSSGADFP
jgi:hypothetical protein